MLNFENKENIPPRTTTKDKENIENIPPRTTIKDKENIENIPPRTTTKDIRTTNISLVKDTNRDGLYTMTIIQRS